jgi:hypothetical protein
VAVLRSGARGDERPLAHLRFVEAVVFCWWFSTFANYKTATGSLTILLFMTAYFDIAAIILLVAIELDELLREDAGSAERAIHELF